MQAKEKTAGLLKIGELARATGVNASTLKYYLREGLLEPACKTGPNMAYYHPACIERIRLIRTLQSEKFYPLAVIKRLLQSGVDIREVELLDAIHKTGRGSLLEQVPAAEALRAAGVTRAQAEALAAAGVITPRMEGRKRSYSRADCRVMALCRRREEAGIPSHQTLGAFAAYQAQLRLAAREDIESLIAEGLLPRPLETRDIVRIIRTSDETLDEFVSLKRNELNRAFGSAQIARMEGFIEDLRRYIAGLAAVLEGEYPEEAALCKAAMNGRETGEAALNAYAAALGLGDQGLASSLAVCHRANACFASRPEGLLAGLLWLGWHAFAPAALESRMDTAQAAAIWERLQAPLRDKVKSLLPAERV